eukprot:2369590-Pleurochrysis_carterae.AAC.1
MDTRLRACVRLLKVKFGSRPKDCPQLFATQKASSLTDDATGGHSFEEVRMVTALAQLHDELQQVRRRRRSRRLRPARCAHTPSTLRKRYRKMQTAYISPRVVCGWPT